MSDFESKVKGDLKKPLLVVDDIIDLNSPSYDDGVEEGTPLRPIFCLKNRNELKDFEDKEDCFILDFDPDESLSISKLSVSSNADDSPDVFLVAEKGQVACRDFPHSRHSCAKYPFSTTDHESYCQLCYCFVCDVAAPCENWDGSSGHCHAINNEAWKLQRKAMQTLQKAVN
ncbi:hypothetical protein DCAR_0312017 [Daucus carota subsp. sativus]|uniref:Uncharacterized protein n=1 Tax=Daucus carota subsp. sativus TaxID=79200 RepID=A0A169W8N2_DAUCS|nr:PREDICTED: uncharacterized protein LOC108215284 [Daucus carota subsp. sativus]XP_017243202.1 PREDICTED: uncharacterized protein LOC108215284 [Daucus carota subsp. sativus]WOG92742.1 hypothetical protein DCAR_0312017 [Daucus carota subsp. sativus]